MNISGVLEYPAKNDGTIRLLLDARSGLDEDRQISVLVRNFAPSGILIESDETLFLNCPLEIVFSDQRIARGEITWTGSRLYGCQFEQEVDEDIIGRLMAAAVREDTNVAAPSDPTKSFGATIRRLRIAKGLNQTDIAEKLGVSTVAISNWEANRSQPRRQRIAELAIALGVASDQLVISSVAASEPLPELLAASKMQVARMLGVEPANVKINVNIDL